jgi:plasmid stability protein
MTTLQIRNMPDDLHRRLKVRAAQQGSTLSELVLSELRRVADRPTRAEVLARILARSEVSLDHPADELVRAERDIR